MDLIRQFERQMLSRLEEKNPFLQILLGPRQVGKTTGARAIYDSWKGPKIMDTADSPTPPQASWITHHWEQARLQGPKTLLILDEVQKVPGWSEEIKRLYDADRGRLDLRVLLLGSSSLYLQKGMRESLAGRFELVLAPHWSFSEFREAFGWSFDRYLRFGAYPGAVALARDEARWRSYIRDGIIDPILGKDILGQHPVANPALFRQCFELAVQYPAQIISLQKLLGQLQDRGNAATIRHYLNLMEQSFLIKTLQKFTGSALQTRASSPKIVVRNQALIHAYQPVDRLRNDPVWEGHVFESLVGAALLQIPESELYYWREGAHEVDYVLKTPGKFLAIEIKSGKVGGKGQGVQAFVKRYPGIRCEVWDRRRCVDFLTNGVLEI